MSIFYRKPNVEKMRDKGDLEGLFKALGHKDYEVRGNAAEALGKIGDKRAVEPLIQTLLEDKSAYVRGKAAEALDKLGWEPRDCM